MPGALHRAGAEGGIAETGGETVEPVPRAGEYVFLNLRLRDGFALADFESRFGESFDEIFGARAARLFEGELAGESTRAAFVSAIAAWNSPIRFSRNSSRAFRARAASSLRISTIRSGVAKLR